jgi:hypothetical protein
MFLYLAHIGFIGSNEKRLPLLLGAPILLAGLLMLYNPVRFGFEQAIDLRNASLQDLAINDSAYDSNLLTFLTTVKSQGLSFYMYNDPSYHRILGQLRLGDAHPALFQMILRGYRIGPVGSLKLFTPSVHKEPCTIFDDLPRDVIVTLTEESSPPSQRDGTRLIASCLEKADAYIDLRQVNGSSELSDVANRVGGLKQYRIFLRKQLIH